MTGARKDVSGAVVRWWNLSESIVAANSRSFASLRMTIFIWANSGSFPFSKPRVRMKIRSSAA